jgi:acetyl-CoA acetyltransferase family protein
MTSWITKNGNERNLYYIGWNNNEKRGIFRNSIGLAISKGNGPFKKVSAGPILDRSIHDPGFTASCSVLRVDDEWWMWYLSCVGWKIQNGEAEIIFAGGVESMSNIPLFFGKKMTALFGNLMKAKTLSQKLSVLTSFRLHFLTPVIGLVQGLTDPISGLIMGCTAENIAKDFKITREEQDQFSLRSHQKAEAAMTNGNFKEEIIPVFNNDEKNSLMIEEDEGVRKGQTLEALAKMKPYFEKVTGTVTVANSSQVTDGAAFALLMSESKAKELGLEVLGYIRNFAYAGMDPSRMGLGPVFASKKLFDKTGLTLQDMELIEINEAFAAQVIGCTRAFASDEFCEKHFGMKQAMGEINPEILNANGGGIALGHPVGMSGARIIIHLLRELKRRGKNRGLATLCIGGGQGGAVILEVN